MVICLPIQEIQIWKIPWRRKWQPTPVFLLGKSHGRRSPEGYNTWGHKDRTWLIDWAHSVYTGLYVTIEAKIKMWRQYMLNRHVMLILFLSSRRTRHAPKSSSLHEKKGFPCAFKVTCKGLALDNGWAFNLTPSASLLGIHPATSTEYCNSIQDQYFWRKWGQTNWAMRQKSSFLNRSSL